MFTPQPREALLSAFKDRDEWNAEIRAHLDLGWSPDDILDLIAVSILKSSRVSNPDDVAERCRLVVKTIQRTRAALETRYLADDFGE